MFIKIQFWIQKYSEVFLNFRLGNTGNLNVKEGGIDF